jgi:hypothetical protein
MITAVESSTLFLHNKNIMISYIDFQGSTKNSTKTGNVQMVCVLLRFELTASQLTAPNKNETENRKIKNSTHTASCELR